MALLMRLLCPSLLPSLLPSFIASGYYRVRPLTLVSSHLNLNRPKLCWAPWLPIEKSTAIEKLAGLLLHNFFVEIEPEPGI